MKCNTTTILNSHMELVILLWLSCHVQVRTLEVVERSEVTESKWLMWNEVRTSDCRARL
jgi:hypothetical protein